MPNFNRGVFKGEKTKVYLESELKALIRIYNPSTMYGDDMDDFKASLKGIAEDFQKFDNYNLEEFYNKVIENQIRYDPQFVAPDF